MTDPIADMLTQIRNAVRLKKPTVELPHSKLKHAMAKLLERDGWLSEVRVTESPRRMLTITLRYGNDGTPMIRALRRVSRPGRRVYVSKTRLPVVLSHFGVAILSTSSGLMTNKEARKRGVGGEVLCEIS